MTDERTMFRDAVRKVLTDFSSAPRDNFQGWPTPLWSALEVMGVTGIGTPEALGGSGGSVIDSATAVFEVGRMASAVPLAETSMLSGWLNELVGWRWTGGAETAALAYAPELECRLEGHSLSISGRVGKVPWARVASRILLYVPRQGDSYLVSLVPRDYSVASSENLAGEPRDAILIDRMKLGADQWSISPITSEDFELRGALARSVLMAGAVSSVIDATTAYSFEREQFGRPIARFQAVQNLLARMTEEGVAAVTSARAAVDAVGTEYSTIAALSATIRVRKSATRVARMAHQVHGAIGITMEFPLHYWTSRLWSWRNEYGSQFVWSERLAAHVRDGGGADELWPMLTQQSLERTQL